MRFTLISKFKIFFPRSRESGSCTMKTPFLASSKAESDVNDSDESLVLEARRGIISRLQGPPMTTRRCCEDDFAGAFIFSIVRATGEEDNPNHAVWVVSRSFFLMERLPSNFSVRGGEDDPWVAVFFYNTCLGMLHRCLRCRISLCERGYWVGSRFKGEFRLGLGSGGWELEKTFWINRLGLRFY